MNFCLRTSKDLRTLEMIRQLNQRLSGNDFDLRTCPSRLGSACAWTDQALAAPVCANRCRQHTCNRCNRTIQCKLAQDGESAQRIRRNGPNCTHQPERDREIVVAALL